MAAFDSSTTGTGTHPVHQQQHAGWDPYPKTVSDDIGSEGTGLPTFASPYFGDRGPGGLLHSVLSGGHDLDQEVDTPDSQASN